MATLYSIVMPSAGFGGKFGLFTGFTRGEFSGTYKGGYTTKNLPRGHYRGKGCAPTGKHTIRGGYNIQPYKVVTYVVPDLTDFKLKPYVSHTTPKLVKGVPVSRGEKK